jgi:serine phosphatase RsbU (regulator of sigma subunit)/anti-sigma regulatory factor (Ser/Thr protein kinase)
MATRLKSFWQNLLSPRRELEVTPTTAAGRATSTAPLVEIGPADPLLVYFQSAPGVVELDKLHNLDSPALRALQTAGVKLVVPLVSQGELIGLINLGPRLSEQEYSTDDRKLLNDLATQAAPAVRIAQLAREQQLEAAERERLEQELRVARLIQQTLLPKELPNLPGWQLSTYYQPARAVGGDFYDFLYFPDGKVGLVVGDVTDKGVPAALVMATTRSILRAAAEQLVSPGAVLERVNDLLHPDIPPKMFVTCLYALLDPASGHLRYANAGHDVPYRRAADGVSELRATGMPLGLLPGMSYEEKETVLAPGDSVLFYSDGLVEAHSTGGEMLGFPRLRELMGVHPGGAGLIDFMLGHLATFTGPGWEQEDDVTLVTLQRAGPPPAIAAPMPEPTAATATNGWHTVAEFSLPSEPGNERVAMNRVSELVQPYNLPAGRVERLKTAVAEATMNAMEHGNQYRPDVPVAIQLLASASALVVRITDQGGSQEIPDSEEPNLESKLAGLQTPRGWGLFLIKNMVDEMRVTSDEIHHTIELVMRLEQGDDENAAHHP